MKNSFVFEILGFEKRKDNQYLKNEFDYPFSVIHLPLKKL
jgi:hypothetical protein